MNGLYITKLDETKINMYEYEPEIVHALNYIHSYSIKKYEKNYPQDLFWIEIQNESYFAIPGFWVLEVKYGGKNE